MKADYVVAVGVACIDEYYAAPTWIAEGDKLVVSVMPPLYGGMVANAACALVGFGVKTYLFDQMNRGAVSQRILDDLERHGVDTSLMRYDERLPDARCLILQTPSERTIFVVDAQKPRHIEMGEQAAVFERAAYLYSTARDFSRFDRPLELAARLKRSGVKLVFDVESTDMEEFGAQLIEEAALLFFNEYGFELYAAGRAQDEVFARLLEKGVSTIAVTLGERGCLVKTREGILREPAVSVPVVDTTGAGDMFNAAFLACVMHGRDAGYAARFATAAAAYAVTQQGGRCPPNSVSAIEAMMRERFGEV